MSTTWTRLPGEPLVRILDNPLLVAQARRRLRRKDAFPTLVITATVAAFALLFGFVNDAPAEMWRSLSLGGLVVIGIQILFRAPLHLATTVSEERLSGLLDFHRATPTTPWTDGLGYVVGCAARELATAAILLPAVVVAGLMGDLGLLDLAMGVGVLTLSSLLYLAYGLLAGLRVSGRKAISGHVVGVLVVLGVLAKPLESIGLKTISYLTPVPALQGLFVEARPEVSLFGLDLPPVVYTVLVQGILLAFLAWGAARKLRNDDWNSFSRVGALLFHAVVVLLLLGGSWQAIGEVHEKALGAVATTSLAVCAFIAALFLMTLSPTHLVYVRARDRAERLGRDGVDWREDGAPPWGLAAGLMGINIGAFALLAVAITGQLQDRALLLSAPTATALAWTGLFLAFVAGATHHLRMTWRGSARAWGFLLLFVTVVLPWMTLGVLHDVLPQSAQLGLASLSPLFGLGGSLVRMAEVWGVSGEPGPAELEVWIYASGMVTAALTGGLAWWTRERMDEEAELRRQRQL